MASLFGWYDNMQCQMMLSRKGASYSSPSESYQCANEAGEDKWLIPLCKRCAQRNRTGIDTVMQETRRMCGLPASRAYMKRLDDPFYILAKSEEGAFTKELVEIFNETFDEAEKRGI
jgi:hypothetical protein